MIPRVLLAAEEAAGAETLKRLIQAPADLVAVLTSLPESGPGGRIVRAARDAGVDLLPAGRVRDPAFGEVVRSLEVDVLLNVHSLHLIAEAVLQAPKLGSFNLHPGPLPEYAGLNTPAWAIYEDALEYGVTLHWMEPKVDAGDVAYQDRFPLEPDATALSLGIQCSRRGLGLVDRLIEDLGRGTVPRTPQDLSRRRYFARGSAPQGGVVQWARPARDVERLSRSFDYGPFPSPWGRLTSRLGGGAVELGKMTVGGATASIDPGRLRIASDGSLEVATLDRWMRVRSAWMDGHRTDPDELLRTGDRFEDVDQNPGPPE